MEEKVYGGTFRILDKEYNGQIRFNNEKYLILEIYISSPIVNYMDFNYKNIDIRGNHVTGSKVTLLNCSYKTCHSHVSYCKSIIVFKCEYLVWGEIHDYKIKSLYTEIENGVIWSGLSGIYQNYFNDGYFDTINFKDGNSYNISYNNYNINLYTKFINKLGARPMPEKATISERLVIKIESVKNNNLYEYVKVLKDFINLITFSTDNNVNILSMYCEDEDLYQILDDGTKRYIKMAINQVYNPKPIFKQNLCDDIVKLDKIDGKILNCFLNEYDNIKPIIELYTMLINNPQLPSHIQFLNIIQAVESFHARFICDSYKKYLKSIDKKFKGNKNEDFYYKFLKPEQQNGIEKYIVLTSRLNDCFIRICPEVFEYFKDGIIATKITDTRHYFTHYEKNKYDKILKGNDLDNVVSLLIIVLNYLIWKHFGLDRKQYLIDNISQLDIDFKKKTP